MADPEPGTVADAPPAHSGGLKATLKRIKPGEWALIGLGIASLVLFYIWYQNQQSNNSSTTNANGTTNPNPQWSGADAQGNGVFDSEIAALLTQIASGQFTTPSTAVTTLGGGSGSPGSSTGGSTGGIAGSAQGSSSQSDVLSTKGLVNASASSGSGITHVNQSPVRSTASVVHATTNETGKVGVNIPGTKTEKAPANVARSIPQSTQSGGETLGSEPRPARKPPANVTRSSPKSTQSGARTVGSAPKPRPTVHPVPPKKPPANVRPR